MRHSVTIFVLMACLGPALARADAPGDLEGLLALPPSPGVEALLGAHAADPRVPQRWRDALQDPDPQRRAAAARMLGVASVRTALGAVVQAARTENHPVPLAEVLRTLVIIGSEHSDPIVIGRLAAVPAQLQIPIVETMASLRPAVLLRSFVAPGPLATSPEIVRAVHGRLLGSAPAQAAEFERVITAHGIEGAVGALVHEAARRGRRVSIDTLIAATGGPSGSALAVLEWLARLAGSPERAQADSALVKAYNTLRDGMPPATGTHVLELALLDRWFGRGSASLAPAWIEAAPRGPSGWWQLSPTAFAVLDREERKALAARLGMDERQRNNVEHARFARQPAAPMSHGAAVSLLADVPAAMLADLRRLTGCAAAPVQGDRPAIVVYGTDGRARQATIGEPALAAGCERYAKVFISIAYGEPTPTGPDAAPNRTILRLDEPWAACLQEAQSGAAALRSADSSARDPGEGTMQPPRKTHNRQPIYPAVAQERRIEGAVVLEAIISPGGCVPHARIVRSIPLLDLAALQAVSHWRYTPALLEGKPVPVLMTVTVNFALQ